MQVSKADTTKSGSISQLASRACTTASGQAVPIVRRCVRLGLSRAGYVSVDAPRLASACLAFGSVWSIVGAPHILFCDKFRKELS